jgi:hypothetical protein
MENVQNNSGRPTISLVGIAEKGKDLRGHICGCPAKLVKRLGVGAFHGQPKVGELEQQMVGLWARVNL